MGKKKETLNKAYFERYWRMYLTNIVVNLFKWEGLPEEINACAMEKFIMTGGYCIFFKDKALDTYFALPGALTGVDVYGYPTQAKPIPRNGDINFPQLKVNEECVLIYCNKTRTTALRIINEYVDKLSDIDAAIKMNTLAMKHPVMIRTSEQTRESFETLMHQYEDNYYILIGDKALTLDNSVEVLNLNVSSQEIKNLQLQKDAIMNEFYSLFGIAGTVEKRERVISGEMNAQMEQVSINRSIWLSERQRAIDKIKDIYGLNIKVDYNVEDPEVDVEEKKEEKKDE